MRARLLGLAKYIFFRGLASVFEERIEIYLVSEEIFFQICGLFIPYKASSHSIPMVVIKIHCELENQAVQVKLY